MVAFSLSTFSESSEVQKVGMNPKLKGDLTGKNKTMKLFPSQLPGLKMVQKSGLGFSVQENGSNLH